MPSDNRRSEHSATPPLPRARAFADLQRDTLALNFCLLFLLALSIGGCSVHQDNFGSSRNPSQNAVDSVVEPDTDLRIKIHRSQEHPEKLGETEHEIEGNTANDNAA